MPIKRASKAKMVAKGAAALATAAKTMMNSRKGGKGGSRTTSLLARKTKMVTLKPGGATTSAFSHKCPLPAYMKQVFAQNAPQVYVTNTSVRQYAGTGVQQAAYQTACHGGNTGGDFTAGDMGQILNQVYGGTPTASQKTTRIYVHKCLQQYMFTNNQTNNIFVDIYDVVARRDSGWNPSAAFNQGLIDQGITSGNAAINVTPFMSTIFTQNWKVLKKTNIELGPGVSHRHISNIALNKVWNAERMQEGGAHYAGLTTGVLLVVWGAPCHDATTVGNVTTASTLLDCVGSRQITYAISQLQVTSTKYVTVLPTITTEREVNEESGLPATVSS